MVGSAALGFGPAGSGLIALGESDVKSIDSFFLAGANDPFGFAQPFSGPVVMLPGDARSLRLDGTTLSGTASNLEANGLAGDQLLRLSASGLFAEYLPQHFGMQLVVPPLAIVSSGVIPGSGVLSESVNLPSVSPLSPFALNFHQGFFFGTAGEAILSSGSATLTLP